MPNLKYPTPKNSAIALIKLIEEGAVIMSRANALAKRMSVAYGYTMPEAAALVWHLIEVREVLWSWGDDATGEGDWLFHDLNQIKPERFRQIIEQMRSEGYIAEN